VIVVDYGRLIIDVVGGLPVVGTTLITVVGFNPFQRAVIW